MRPETETLVVGAGPVGLFTAVCLSEAGVRVRIIDKYRRASLRSYALALHAETLRRFDELGLAEPLIERGQSVERIAVYRDDRRVAELGLPESVSSMPFALVLPQPLLEGVLEQRLHANGVDVEWGRQLLTFDSESTGVTVLLARTGEPGDVETLRLRTQFLVGADGEESLVRRLLGVESRVVGEAMTYGLLEFDSALDDPHEMRLVLRQRSTDVLWAIGPERGRWGVQLGEGDPYPDFSLLRDRIGARAPWFNGNFGSVDWITGVRFESRLARSFGRGRVWLVGDAAHFASPVGVQSMNVGIREGQDLARRVAAILKDGASSKLLRVYNEDRMREWKMLLGVKDRLQSSPDVPAWADGLGPRLVPALPASGRDLSVILKQLGMRLFWMRGTSVRRLDEDPGASP